jgi:hypothetical protein
MRKEKELGVVLKVIPNYEAKLADYDDYVKSRPAEMEHSSNDYKSKMHLTSG